MKLDLLKIEPIPALRHLNEYLPLTMIARVTKSSVPTPEGEEGYVIHTTDKRIILITKTEFEAWFNTLEA